MVSNKRVLAAFRRDLMQAGLMPATAEGHFATIEDFAQSVLAQQSPPRPLIELTSADIERYLRSLPVGAERPKRDPLVSLRRFIRFLLRTGRIDYEVEPSLRDALKR